MQADATPSNQVVRRKTHERHAYQKVLDARKRPVRGLWKRNGRFYARLAIADHLTGEKATRRVPLPATTVAEAIQELSSLRVDRERNELPVLKQPPVFRDFAASYLAHYATVSAAKRATTLDKEKRSLARWSKHIGGLRLDRIARAHINRFIAARQQEGVTGRTVNLDVIALRNCLKHALDEGWLRTLPTEGMRPLRHKSPTRPLTTMADVEAICAAGLAVSKNGRQFADYVRLMALCGSRRSETLRLRWPDVDFDLRQITIGSDGLSKNGEARTVDFSPALEAHLRAMHVRRAPDTDWLFPSPQRGLKDIAAATLRETLVMARAEAGLPGFRFHDCRHAFVSLAVMAGVDFMTIAAWVGHKDGGVLIGKVYGHLADQHRKSMAARLTFEPQAVILPAQPTG